MDIHPAYRLHPLTQSEGGGYVVEFVAYPTCQGWGHTADEALQAARRVLDRMRGSATSEACPPAMMMHWRLPASPFFVDDAPLRH